MNQKTKRQAMINESIRRIASFFCQEESMKKQLNSIDFVITKVNITPDFSLAKIHFSTSANIDYTKEILEKNKGLLRSKIAQEIQIRKTPDLLFYEDDMIIINKIIANVKIEKIKDDIL